MNTKQFCSVLILATGITISVILVGDIVFAQEQGVGGKKLNVQYPIAELGNCKNEADCRSYCDKQENVNACISFAEKNNLMRKEEIEVAKKFVAIGKGPGGCTTKESCEAFCEDINHINECVSFAEKNDFVPREKLEEVKKVKAAIESGIKPPPCKNKKECDAYCEAPEHMLECIAFGEAAGFLSGKELEDSRKMLSALEKGIKPPACRGKEQCDAYCSNPSNMEECMTFAEAAGFMGEKERKDAKKMLLALKKGVKPPACRGKEECDAYCGDENHFEECIAFAEAAGFMKPEEVEMARKTKGKGPGGCTGKEECEAFCNNPQNQETCFLFGKEHGLIQEEELRKMDDNKQKFAQSFMNAPPDVVECLQSSLGIEMVEKFKSGSVMPSRDAGNAMRICFEKAMRPPGIGIEKCEGENCPFPPPGIDSKMMPPQAGPGGCKSPEECQSYCESHGEECKNFGQQPQLEQMRGEGGMRNDMQFRVPEEGFQKDFIPCRTPEECGNIKGAPQIQMMEMKEFIQGIAPFRGGGEIKKEIFEGKEIFDSRELMERFSPKNMDERTKQMMQDKSKFYPDIIKQQPQIYNQQFMPPGTDGQQQFMPPQGFSPSTEFIPTPPPSGSFDRMQQSQSPPSQTPPPPPPPSPSGAISPQSLLGLIFSVFTGNSH